MTIEILKETLTETGNPFVWITDNGWYFNEQKDSVKYTAEQVFSVESFEQLSALNTKQAEPVIETTKVTTKKK